MDTTTATQELLAGIGGPENLSSVSLSMTRIRLVLKDPWLTNFEIVRAIPEVLACQPYDGVGIDVVFGAHIAPAIADAIGEAASLPVGRAIMSELAPDAAHHRGPARGVGSGGASKSLGHRDLERLREMLASVDGEEPMARDGAPAPKLLVLNGPNMNLMGLREPELYGSRTYRDVVELCERAGAEAGFSTVTCYQSNHEGDLVGAIQDAYGVFDAIVINPAAYTHTSIAILDALKAVGLPAVEVHVSDVASREAFRQTSYVREACVATVMGEGIEGYAHAIRLAAEALGL